MANNALTASAVKLEPSIFSFQGSDLRVIGRNDEPWFVAKDVVDGLGLSRTDSAVRDLDDDEKGTHIVSTPGGPQEMTLISEPGFYKLVGRSRKPAAKRFDRWVRHEVLPTIRKTGSYGQPTLDPAQISSLIEKAVTKALDRRFPRDVVLRQTAAEKHLTTIEVVQRLTEGKAPHHGLLVIVGRRLVRYCRAHGHITLTYRGKKMYPESAVNAWLEQGGRLLIMSGTALKKLILSPPGRDQADG